MINYLWFFMIVFSFVSALFRGTMGSLSGAVLSSGAQTVEMCLKLLGALCLWCGLMNIAQESGLCDIIAKILRPAVNFLLPGTKKNKEAQNAVAMNVTANLLGLGNAATPLGIEAMRRLKELSGGKNDASRDMAVFVVMNTAALKIIPSTVASLRASFGAKEPMDIIFCVWISSAASLIAAVGAVKLTGRRKK